MTPVIKCKLCSLNMSTSKAVALLTLGIQASVYYIMNTVCCGGCHGNPCSTDF